MNSSAPFAVVVHADPTQRDLLAGLLRDAGLASRVFCDAEAALAEMSGDAATEDGDPGVVPAIIVTDLYMPGLDGWRFCRLLRSPEYASFNRVPLLVVSATFAGDEPARIAADIGADAFLPCPVDGQRFREQVRVMLSGERMRIPLRILIVDDNAALCDLLARVFKEQGYEVETALSSQAAIQAFAQTAFDVAVLDYRLPDGPGDALLDQFRARRPDCVCLMITSDTGPDLALDWMKRGAAAYVLKPFKPAYLLELCANARRERALLRVQDLLEVRTSELRESEERYRSLVEDSPDAIGIYQAGRLVFLNSTGVRQFGAKTKQELLGRRTEEFIHPDDLPEATTRLQRRLAGETGLYPARVHYLRPDGTTLPAEVTATPVTFHNKPAVQFIARDITERQRAEAERAKLEARSQQSQKMESVGRLAGGVAHDFNNMLQAILGNVGLALDALPNGGPVRESLEEIQKAARRSADLTRQLLAFARQQTIAPKVLDLNEAVERLLKMLRRLLGEDIHLAWLPSAGLGLVKIDPVQIDQILANLCVNARDAIGGVGKITIETGNATFDAAYCADHPGVVPGEYVRLAVSDNGCGMEKATLAHLFEPFFTTKGIGKGTGLGLATVYGIVNQNNGFIQVYSEPGKGTTFTIHLTRHEGPADASHTELCAPPARSHGEMVLLVEDEPSILAIAERILLRLGYTVLAASTPSEAIRLARAHEGKIHLLMTDVVMPEMNGRDLARELVSHAPDLKCLFMSGYTADVIAIHGVLDENVRFIHKPFSLEDLAAKVREALGTA